MFSDEERGDGVYAEIAQALTPNSRRVLVEASDGSRFTTMELRDHGLMWFGFQRAHITPLGDKVGRWLETHGKHLPRSDKPSGKVEDLEWQ